MPPTAIPLPQDVLDYIYELFQSANDRVAAKMDRMPTIHEEHLDFTLVEALSEGMGPHLLPSSTVVDIDIHFLGSGWHWERWEVADLGMLVTFRRAGRLLRTKSVLLQSKRLYPVEAEFVEDRGLTRHGGYGSLLNRSEMTASVPRSFHFNDNCRYKALQVGDDQWRAIEGYESHFGIPVHYLLYHPSELPHQQTIPVRIPVLPRATPSPLASRVLRAAELRARAAGQPRNSAPSYADLSRGASLGWRLQEFVRDEVLTCREGYVSDHPQVDEGLNRVFTQRGAPIAAAIRIDIDLPEEAAGTQG
jgi:hypothetical protein